MLKFSEKTEVQIWFCWLSISKLNENANSLTQERNARELLQTASYQLGVHLSLSKDTWLEMKPRTWKLQWEVGEVLGECLHT